jgi:hypothetical protein
MTLGLTQPLTRIFLADKARLARKADNVTAICELTVYKIFDPRRLTTLQASTVCYFVQGYLR